MEHKHKEKELRFRKDFVQYCKEKERYSNMGFALKKIMNFLLHLC